MKKKILHILNSDKLSGAENVAADICMMLNDEYEMVYCSPSGSIKKALKDRKVNYIPLKNNNILELNRVIKFFKPDIIHSHDIRATVLASIVARKIPIVSHVHGNSEEMRRVGIKSVAFILATKRVKTIISVSESIIKDFIFNNSIIKKNLILNNVIYTKRVKTLALLDKEDYSFDFVYLGRLTHPKNPQRIARVASLVLKQCPKSQFGIIGEGEGEKEMKEIFHAAGVLNQVVFTGQLDYPYKALQQAKCMFMCSIYEGTPIAALEAMSLGVPIVSTPVDGMLDLVEDGKTGFLSSDDDSLKNAIINILKDNRLQKEMSNASIKKLMKINNIDEYKKNLELIYESL